MKRIAITRKVSPAIENCELTHLERQPISYEIASRQHDDYEALLEDLGYVVQSLDPVSDLPDSVFVEDAAVVLEELAVITRPGAESRRAETDSIARALEPWRKLAFIEDPATLDGGDVLVIGKRVWVGLSSRTNQDGVDQLRAILEPRGYQVRCLDLRECLHLKTAVTLLRPASTPGERDTIIINPQWIDREVFEGLTVIEVDPSEPSAANALLVGETVVLSTAFPKTLRRLEDAGIDVRTVDATELAKAEGGLTCCSLIFEA